MISRKRNSQSGMTLIEVLTSLVILSLLVLPIASYFTMAAATRTDSQSVAKATVYAENLLSDIKEQIDEDVYVQRMEESNPKFDSGYNNLVPRTLAKDKLRDYVKKGTIIEDSSTKSEFQYELYKYLYKDKTKFDTEYETDKYAYEAVVWRIDQETIKYIKNASEPDLLNWSNDALNRGLRLYNNSKYTLSGIDKDAAKINLPPDLLKDNFITKDEYLAGKVERNSTKNYAASVTISDKGIVTLDYQNVTVLLEKDIKKNKLDDAAGRKCYRLTVGGTGTASRTLLIDATKIHPNMANDAVTIEIVNDNPSSQLVVQVRKSVEGELKDPNERKALTKTELIERKLRLVPTKGSIVFDRPKDIEVEDVYLIAIIVRNLNPATGKKAEDPTKGNKGKIIKKMVEFYSYDDPKM